jgi:AhpD family alkylhydroperoxidase
MQPQARFRFPAGVALCLLIVPLAMPALTPLAILEQEAHQRVNAKARVPLAESSSASFTGIETVESPGSDRIPNYLRAIAVLPKMPGPFAHLFRAFVLGGALPSETRLAMALRIAQVNNSPYTAVHIERLLRTTGRGRLILDALKSNTTNTLAIPEQRAVEFAEASTKHVDGLTDTEFQGVRAVYNDSQIVELHFISCFFNYFTRFTEALNLPVEAWALETAPAVLPSAPSAQARVALITDGEINAVAAAAEGLKRSTATATASSLGIPIANSQRAMLRAPAMYQAWREFGAAEQQYASVSREIKLQVSFAVSTANGCRYCTLHQVLGLRRLGVEPSKLMAMQKDDSALTSEELTAVLFARKLTAEPSGITDADYDNLRKVFHEQGALEALMQTCNFAFMNRFTDGLRLPSEDEAVRVYRETYGAEWQRRKK